MIQPQSRSLCLIIHASAKCILLLPIIVIFVISLAFFYPSIIGRVFLVTIWNYLFSINSTNFLKNYEFFEFSSRGTAHLSRTNETNNLLIFVLENECERYCVFCLTTFMLRVYWVKAHGRSLALAFMNVVRNGTGTVRRDTCRNPFLDFLTDEEPMAVGRIWNVAGIGDRV